MATLPWIELATKDKDVAGAYNERKGREGAGEVRDVETRTHNAICYRATMPHGSNAGTKVVLSGQDELARFNGHLIAQMYKRGIIE
jgi:hypothetical protein